MFSDDPNEDLEFLIYIHDEIIEASGGAKGMHDEKLVRSALARPLHSAFGEDIYKEAYSRAAALLDAIANNHGFRDGNKRTAMAAASYYLDTRDIAVDYTNAEYEEFMLHVVNDKPQVSNIADWLKSHGHKLPATKWMLADVTARAKESPKTFEIPTPEEIGSLRKSSLVKLIFEITNATADEPTTERMWVQITEIKGNHYIGRLDNDPFHIRGLYAGDVIEFTPENIASV